MSNENYLIHHGVKGQKWGVRRYRNVDGSLTGQGRSHLGIKEERGPYKEQNQVTNANKMRQTDAAVVAKNQHMYTTKQLNEVLNRIETNRKLQEIASSNTPPSMAKRGRDAVFSIAGKFGSAVVDNLVNRAADAAADKIVTSASSMRDRLPSQIPDFRSYDYRRRNKTPIKEWV